VSQKLFSVERGSPFACFSVLLFITADSARTAEKYQQAKNNQTTAKTKTSETSSACDKVVCFGEE